MTIFEKILRDFKFELPSSGIHFFEVNTETVDHPKEALQQLLLDNQALCNDQKVKDIHTYEKQFAVENNLHITFSEDGIQELIRLSIVNDSPIPSLCNNLFKDLAYGLKIVSKNTNKDTFLLDKDFISNPQQTISKWIVDSFQGHDGKPTQNDCK